MNPVTPARRRAERFDDAVEGAPTSALDEPTLKLLGLVADLRDTSRPSARPAFVSALRSQLMVAAGTELVTIASRPAKVVRSKRERRIAVALGGFALVGATTSMAVAAQSALPGETLYPLKRAIENADTGLSAQSSKGQTLLTQATDRLSELDELSHDSSQDETLQASTVDSTLATFSDQASEAADLMLASYARTGSQPSINALRTFAGTSLATLGQLEADLPPSVRPSVLYAAQTLFRIDDAASQACPECGAAGITTVPGGLVSTSFPLQSLDPGAGLGNADPSAPSSANGPTKNGPTTSSTTVETAPTTPVPTATPTSGVKLPAGGGPSLPTNSAGATGGATKKGTDGGLLGGLGTLLGQGATTSTPTPVPTPPALLPGLGGLLEGTADTVTGITDPLLP